MHANVPMQCTDGTFTSMPRMHDIVKTFNVFVQHYMLYRNVNGFFQQNIYKSNGDMPAGIDKQLRITAVIY